MWSLGSKVYIDISAGEAEPVYRVRKGSTTAEEGITKDEAIELAEDLIVIQNRLRK